MGIPTRAPVTHDIDERADLDVLVRRFYQAVIPDPLLGPIFEAVHVDWAAHIPKLVDFWCGRLLGEPGYAGNPVGAHQPVLDTSPFGDAEIARWLTLWAETVDELFVGPIAELAKERAALAGHAISSLARRHAQLMPSPPA